MPPMPHHHIRNWQGILHRLCSPGLINKSPVAWHPPWRSDIAPTFPLADPAWSDLRGVLESDPSI